MCLVGCLLFACLFVWLVVCLVCCLFACCLVVCLLARLLPCLFVCLFVRSFCFGLVLFCFGLVWLSLFWFVCFGCGFSLYSFTHFFWLILKPETEADDFLDTAQTQTQLRLPVLRERQFLPPATSMACGRLVLSSRAATRSIPVQVCRFHRVVTYVNLGISSRDVLTDVSLD